MEHANQCDAVCLQPLEVYLIEIKRMPKSDVEGHYLLNAWLALDFLKKQGVLTNDEREAFQYLGWKLKKYNSSVRDEIRKQY